MVMEMPRKRALEDRGVLGGVAASPVHEEDVGVLPSAAAASSSADTAHVPAGRAATWRDGDSYGGGGGQRWHGRRRKPWKPKGGHAPEDEGCSRERQAMFRAAEIGGEVFLKARAECLRACGAA